jgi:hypothetical protein
MHFKIDIEFTKILIQFKQKEICRFIHDMQFQVFFNRFLKKIVNCNYFVNTILIKIFFYFFYYKS